MSTNTPTIQIPASAAPDIIAALMDRTQGQRRELDRLRAELTNRIAVGAVVSNELLAANKTIRELHAELSNLKAEVEGLTAERDHYRVALNAHTDTALSNHIVDATDMLPSDPPWKLPLPTTPDGWLERIAEAPGEFVKTRRTYVYHRSKLEELRCVAEVYNKTIGLAGRIEGSIGMLIKHIPITPEIRAALDRIPVREEAT